VPGGLGQACSGAELLPFAEAGEEDPLVRDENLRRRQRAVHEPASPPRGIEGVGKLGNGGKRALGFEAPLLGEHAR
jgi:hypothetical protein